MQGGQRAIKISSFLFTRKLPFNYTYTAQNLNIAIKAFTLFRGNTYKLQLYSVEKNLIN